MKRRDLGAAAALLCTPHLPQPTATAGCRCMPQKCVGATLGAVLAQTRRVPPATRAAGGGTDLLHSRGRGASAHHGDLSGPRHGDASHARHGRGRHERRGKAAKRVGDGASAHKSQLLAVGGRSAGGGAPNDGEDGKHGYLRGWRGWGRQEHKRGLNKRGCPSGEVALGGFQARSPPPENCTEVDLASESLGVN